MASRALDTFIVYQFIRLLTMSWEETEAYKAGIVDVNGKTLRKAKTTEDKKAYTLFHRLVFNIKRLLSNLPGGQSKIATYAAALWLLKENNTNKMNDTQLLDEAFIDHFLSESEEIEYVECIQILNNLDIHTKQNLLEEIDMKNFKNLMEEITGVSGIAGVRPGDEPPIDLKKKKKCKTPSIFAGQQCFEVNDDMYHKCVQGKGRYNRYEKYVGNDEIGEEIRAYGRKNPKKPIIIKSSKTGAMVYLKK